MLFYYTFSKGSKWIRLEGEGESPENCIGVKWITSPMNKDMDLIRDAVSDYHPYYHAIEYRDYPNNLYAQANRFGRIVKLGYRFKEGNFPPIVRSETVKIEFAIEDLQKAIKIVHVKATPKRKAHTRRIQVPDKEPDAKKEKSTITPDNIKRTRSLEDIGISGNIHDGASFIVEFKDSSQALYKVMKPIEIAGEVNAFRASKVLGWNIVPETVKGDFGHGEGSCQKWVEGEEAYDPYYDYGEKITEKNIDDLAKIFAFDVITNNRDRHVGNFLVNSDKIWAIDNEEFGFSGAGKHLMERLDDACDYRNQMGWGILQTIENNFGDNQEVFRHFRDLVVDRLKEAVDKEDKILRIYEPIEGYSIKRKSIEESFDYIKTHVIKLEEKK